MRQHSGFVSAACCQERNATGHENDKFSELSDLVLVVVWGTGALGFLNGGSFILKGQAWLCTPILKILAVCKVISLFTYCYLEAC